MSGQFPRKKLSVAILSTSNLDWLEYFLGHAHPLSSSMSALSGPSTTLSESYPPAYTRSVAFLFTWLPPFQPSPTYLDSLHQPLSPCLFHLVHSCFHFFLSYLLHFHISPNRDRELEATCCSFSLLWQLIEVCRPYHQHFLNVCDEPPVVILDHCTSLHVPFILSYIPCRVEYHLFSTTLVKLSVQFFLHTPSGSVHRPPGCLLLLAIQVP